MPIKRAFRVIRASPPKHSAKIFGILLFLAVIFEKGNETVNHTNGNLLTEVSCIEIVKTGARINAQKKGNFVMKKKLFALLLCLVMVVGLAAPAFADFHSLRFDIELEKGYNAKLTVGGTEKRVAYVGQIVTVEANEAGKVCKSVTLINKNNPSDRTTVSGNKFIMPAYDVTVVPTIQNRTYLVIAFSSNLFAGTVTGSGTYEHGANLQLTATARDGYRFVRWSDGVTNQARTDIVTGYMNVYAIFEKTAK